MKIRALSLKQPYANWVVSGRKTIETRTWSTNYRGDVLICASTTGAGEPRGVALGVVRLDGVRPMTKADAAAACVECYPKAQAWEISNLRILKKPFPVKGRLGLFSLEVNSKFLEFRSLDGGQEV